MRSVWLIMLCVPLACGRTASGDGPESSGAAGSVNGGASASGLAGAAGAAGGDVSDLFPPDTNPLAIAWQVAGEARGEALCRCAQPDLVDRQSCVDEETFAPNAICLSALTTPDVEAWQCRTEVLRAEAECYARGPCESGGRVPSCPAFACPEPFASVHAARYCHRRNCVGIGGAPVFARQICDGVPDCTDGADELNCTPGRGAFECTSGEVIPTSALCDTQSDCSDYSDEMYCF